MTATTQGRYPLLQDKNWLHRQRHVQRRTIGQIAVAAGGCTPKTAMDSLIRHGLYDGGRGKGVRPDPTLTADRILEAASAVATWDDLLKTLGCTRTKVENALSRHGIKPSEIKAAFAPRSPIHDPALLAALVDTHTVHEIADMYHYHYATVRKLITDAGLPSPGHIPPATRRAMAAAWLKGSSVAEIAKRWGRSEPTTSEAIKGEGVDVKHRTSLDIAACKTPRLKDRAWMHSRWVDDKATADEIATELGCRPRSVEGWIHRHRIRRARPDADIQAGNLNAANAARTSAAAPRQVRDALTALTVPGLPSAYRTVLQARVDNPDASLAVVAESLGMSKDTYAGLFRRAVSR